jgi:hypothetical protein
MMELSYHGSLDNDTLTNLVCDASCEASLWQWYNSVERNCAGYMMPGGSPPVVFGVCMWAGFNEMCSKDKGTGEYCNGIPNIPHVSLASVYI